MSELTSEDYEAAAKRLGCDVAAIRAVSDVESGPSGAFYEPGEPTFLFEPHIFSKYTQRKYDRTHPALSYPSWRPGGYPKTVAQRKAQRDAAAALDRDAAWKATSWGRFQICGFNHDACGFPTVEAFVQAHEQSEQAQLDAFVTFLKRQGLDAPLRRHEWALFARKYNGPGYARNKYDTKLARAYARYSASA
jgi:hypothetical protein